MLPVVLAPGLLCDHRLWTAIRPRIPGPVIEVDFRDDRDMEEMARRILQAAPERFVLAGFSMGGMASMLAAAQAPERIAGLALIDTHAEPETPERKARRVKQISSAVNGDFRSMVVNELKPAYFAADVDLAPEKRLVASMALDLGVGQFRRHVLALMSRPDPRAALARLTMPAVVIVGEEDALAPVTYAEGLARALPNGRLVVIPRCGHMAPLEAPDIVAGHIAELARSSSPEAS